MNLKSIALLLLIAVTVLPELVFAQGRGSDISGYEWTLVNGEPGWAPRAGLQVLELRNKFYLMGGRTPIDPALIPIPGASTMWSDVWESDDAGKSWQQIVVTDLPSVWSPRAYFQAVTMKGRMYVLGGQDFKLVPNPDPAGPPLVPDSDFFNDVWCSKDGINWSNKTAAAPWVGRAGLSAIVFKNEIYIMGGSFNDDPAIIGGPPQRSPP